MNKGQAVDSIVYGLAAVAQHFGRSERQVRRWLKAGAPALSRNRFDVLQIQAWLDNRQGLGLAPGSGKRDRNQLELPREDSGKDYWDKKSKEFQARQRELDYRRRLGELVERSDVEKLFVERIMAVKGGLLSLSRTLPPQLIHCRSEREMEEIIHRAVRALLEDYSRPLPHPIGTAEGGTSGG
jgi:hypothetical protein